MEKNTAFRLVTNDRKYLVAASHPDAQHRIDRRTRVTESGCIEWTGARNDAGYGVLTVNKQNVYAHRLAYVLKFGGVVSGLAIDHLCHNPACVNTDHMKKATLTFNSSRSLRSAQTHCLRGHEFSDENTRISYDRKDRPHRQCIQCGIDAGRAWRVRRAA